MSKKLESGRSLLEILAIIVIIGILSITGLNLFEKSAVQIRTNDILHESEKVFAAGVTSTGLRPRHKTFVTGVEDQDRTKYNYGITQPFQKKVDGKDKFFVNVGRTDPNRRSIDKKECKNLFKFISADSPIKGIYSDDRKLTPQDCTDNMPVLSLEFGTVGSNISAGADQIVPVPGGGPKVDAFEIKCVESDIPSGKDQKCMTCGADGQWKNKDVSYEECGKCSSGHLTTDTTKENACYKCDSSTYLLITRTDGKTVLCGNNCCKTGTECVNGACKDEDVTPEMNACSGYTLDSCPTGGSCGDCQLGATKKYKLNSCGSGYTLSDGTCVENTCTSTNTSKAGCKAFTSCTTPTNTYYTCTECNTGYSLSDGVCTENTCTNYSNTLPSNCEQAVLACQKPDGKTYYSAKCGKCAGGYYLSGDTCKQCSEDRQYSSAGATSCSTCPAGKTHNSTHTGCQNCTTGACGCSGTTPVADGNGSCKCPDNATCNPSGTITCKDGYTLSNNTCVANTCSGWSITQQITGCASGKQTSCKKPDDTIYYKCSGCNGGYALSDNTCTACSGTNQYSAAGATVCSTCAEGKKPNSTHSGCEDCSAECVSCPTATPYWNSYNKKCQACVYHAQCGSDKYCVGTLHQPSGAGSYVEDGQCMKKCTSALDSCPTGGVCSDCGSGAYKKKQLDKCNSGYYQNGNTCTKCPSNYQTCSGTSFTCKAGYYKNGDTCTACGDREYSAAGATSCSTCPAGKTHNSTHTGCQNCTTGACGCSGTTPVADGKGGCKCKEGTKLGDCLVCSDGKYVQNGSAPKCMYCDTKTGDWKGHSEGVDKCGKCNNPSTTTGGAVIYDGQSCSSEQYCKISGTSATCTTCPEGQKPNSTTHTGCVNCTSNETCGCSGKTPVPDGNGGCKCNSTSCGNEFSCVNNACVTNTCPSGQYQSGTGCKNLTLSANASCNGYTINGGYERRCEATVTLPEGTGTWRVDSGYYKVYIDTTNDCSIGIGPGTEISVNASGEISISNEVKAGTGSFYASNNQTFKKCVQKNYSTSGRTITFRVRLQRAYTVSAPGGGISKSDMTLTKQ